MRLFVANPTAQVQAVCYRLDYDDKGNLKDTNRRFQPARQQDIQPGRQVQLGGVMHEAQINDIVKQLEPYGMIHVDDVSRAPKRKVSYVYSIDKAVPADVMKRVQFHNSAALTEDGRVRRAAAAVASNDMIQHAVANHFIENGIPAEPSDTTAVAFEQQDQSDAGEKLVQEGYEVVPEGKAGPRSGRIASSKASRKK